MLKIHFFFRDHHGSCHLQRSKICSSVQKCRILQVFTFHIILHGGSPFSSKGSLHLVGDLKVWIPGPLVNFDPRLPQNSPKMISSRNSKSVCHDLFCQMLKSKKVLELSHCLSKKFSTCAGKMFNHGQNNTLKEMAFFYWTSLICRDGPWPDKIWTYFWPRSK